MYSSIIEAIGDTPLVELHKLSSRNDGRILAKLKNLNPGAWKKDRVALQSIADAEQDGTLRPGQTVVELTSGNTGTGHALVEETTQRIVEERKAFRADQSESFPPDQGEASKAQSTRAPSLKVLFCVTTPFAL